MWLEHGNAIHSMRLVSHSSEPEQVHTSPAPFELIHDTNASTYLRYLSNKE
jgi:hypothetical protein